MFIVKEKELAEKHIKCSQRHIVSLREKRLIPFIKLGRCVRYDLDAVNKALEKLTIREIS